MNEAPARYLLVDLGGTQVRVGLGDSDGKIITKRVGRTNLPSGPEGVVAQIASMAREVLTETGTNSPQVARLVIAAPGPLEPRTGVVYDAPNMPGWTRVPLKANLEEALGVPVIALNDANAAGLGEYAFGAGRGHHNLVYLTVSTGIGGGVVVEDELLEGTSGTAGEIGHMTIDRHGPRCPCGNIGCLEVLASGTSIARRFRERLEAGDRSELTEQLGGAEATAADISRAAAAGDGLAAAVFQDAAEALGTGVVNCIHIFNPDVIVLGGGVTHAGPLLFDVVREMADRYAMRMPRAVVGIVPAQLGDDAGLYGALAVAMGRVRPGSASA